MAFLSFPALALALSLTLILISPAHSLTCTSQNFTSNKLYKNCTDLPSLKAYLHYTYNASNSSLSIAFIAPPAKSDGWIAWAINPTGTGMAGSQSLLAFKSSTTDTMVVKTYNISSYSSIVESKLSFDVWGLSAESSKDGTMIIYASVKVPAKVEKLNQVWQVGSKVTDGRPNKHDFAAENLNAKGTLALTAKAAAESLAPAPAPDSSSSSSSSSSDPSGSAPSATSGSKSNSTSADKGGALSINKINNVGLVFGLFLFFGSVFTC